MIITKELAGILNNFSNLNSNLYIEPGNKIITAPMNRCVVAQYIFDSGIDNAIGIFDLSRFLKVVSLMGSDPEIHWSNEKTNDGTLSRYLELRSDGRRVRYMQSEKSMLDSPSKSLPDITGSIQFRFTEEHRGLLTKAGMVLDCKYIAFFNKGNDIYAKTFDPDDDSAVMDDYQILIAKDGYSENDDFNIVFMFFQMPSYSGDYDVVVNDFRDGSMAAAQLKHVNGNLSFWVTLVTEHSSIGGE